MYKIELKFKELERIIRRKDIIKENRKLLKEYLETNQITYLDPFYYKEPLRHFASCSTKMFGQNSLPKG